jgi:hypothetical protein
MKMGHLGMFEQEAMMVANLVSVSSMRSASKSAMWCARGSIMDDIVSGEGGGPSGEGKGGRTTEARLAFVVRGTFGGGGVAVAGESMPG